MLTTSNLSYAIDQVVSAVAFERFYAEPFYMPLFYDVRTSSKPSERSASFSGIGDYEEISETASMPEDSQPGNQFEKDFVHVEYGKLLPFSRKIADDEQWGLIEDYGQQLGYKAAYTMEKAAVALFNDVYTGATYKAEDNLSIANAAHVNADCGNSQANYGTNSLNLAGLETTRVAMRAFKNYSGDLAPSRPRLLVIPPALEQTAFELLKSVGKPETANNNINFYNGMMDAVVWDFLTDSNAWFAIDPQLMKMNLIWWQRIALEIYSTGNLFDRSKKVGGYYRCSHGCKDWRWMFFNNPS
jgi:hypothetical protein